VEKRSDTIVGRLNRSGVVDRGPEGRLAYARRARGRE